MRFAILFIFINSNHIEDVEGDTESSQTEKMTEESDSVTDNPSVEQRTDEQHENTIEVKTEKVDEDVVVKTEPEENAKIQDSDKNDQKSKDDNNTQDPESPIRLTLEEEDNFHDDEVQCLLKTFISGTYL